VLQFIASFVTQLKNNIRVDCLLLYRKTVTSMILILFISFPLSAQSGEDREFMDIEKPDLTYVQIQGFHLNKNDDELRRAQGFRDPEIIRTENVSLNLGSRFQLLYRYLNPDEGSDNGSFSIRRARLSLSGEAYQYFDYAMQIEMAGSGVNLIDANIRYRIGSMATLWAGQGKAYFGRQQLVSSGNLNFVDRTEVDARFSAKRQTGIAMTGQNESQTFEYNIGIYNGTGINRANDNGKYMKVARVVFTPFGEFPMSESAHEYPDTPKLAIGISGLHTTDGVSDLETDITRLNLESAFKFKGVNISSEFYWEDARPTLSDSFNTIGWYSQAGYMMPGRRNEVVLRYAVIDSDEFVADDLVETGVAFSHYFYGHKAKLQADLRKIKRSNIDSNDLEFRLQLQVSI
jgi:phosphate-selective porin OprO and OprP